MPDLAQNPHLAIHPDFTSKSYCLARDCLVNKTIDHNTAACQLELLWTHTPLPQDTMIPTEPIIVPAPITTHKLCKGDYCKLYFFTNKGLKDAELTPRSTDNDAMALLQSGDGLHSFVPIAAACTKGNVTRDEDLSWEEFTKAAHHLVSAMSDSGWC
ncbi:hypothetical protein BKA82DRAFT_157591 [Pisolithus tinctorius]|nr:hypothetical protein BKA82DRAFT_157591 [Pisolithus tinctorius]